ncbi:MAG: thermonuclease family protein [Deltaproteobacteria bacterium]|nr:thermonuclease family protein [Deltaproteobacteria bacterium]
MLLLAGALFLLSAFASPRQVLDAGGVVTWVYDGDTIEVEAIGKVRLLGIDTPELEPSERDSYYLRLGVTRKTLRRIARDALHFNIRHLKGKRVTLEKGDPPRDDYGRLLAYVFLPDGSMANLLLIEHGLATVFRRYSFEHREQFLEAEKIARREKRGLWALAPARK